jgi:teichuronic acid biosynthesis glycosyltransferase TuaC
MPIGRVRGSDWLAERLSTRSSSQSRPSGPLPSPEVRALVVSNMQPDQANPERGSFVRDQVAALRKLDAPGSLDVELFEFPPGPRALARAALELRRRFARHAPFDVVHAHFGLTAWPALAVPAPVRALTLHGTDVRHPRTRLLTYAALPTVELLATVSASLRAELPTRLARRAQVLPCGVDVERFQPRSRQHAREQLALDAQRPYLLFPSDPARPEKRFELARNLAAACDVELLTLGSVEPARVPLYVNAANAVLVPSEREGFGLAVLEALACDVPVLATPVGIHQEALNGVAGTLCAPFEQRAWRAALQPALDSSDPRVAGRERAQLYSAERMAERVHDAWRVARERAG